MKYVKHKDGDIHNNNVKNLEIAENSVAVGAGLTGTQLRAIRLKLDLTQQEMAEKLFMSKVMYGLNERGEKPISPRTEALALVLAQRRD